MDNNSNLIEGLHNEIINTDYNCNDLSELNRCMAFENEVVLNVNIRILNANFHKLLVFLISVVMKPCIIVCTKTWNLEHNEYFNIPGYNMYYNNSKINISDVLVIYVSDYITETTEVLTISNLKIINSKIAIENNNGIMISVLYRLHDISKTEFLLILKNLINNNLINKKSRSLHYLIVRIFVLSPFVPHRQFVVTLFTVKFTFVY